MKDQILSTEQESCLTSERQCLRELTRLLMELDPPEEDRGRLEQAILQLDELFLLVVVGEFNSGKSSLINALLGDTLLEEGVTPTTRLVQVLRYGESAGRREVDASTAEISAPYDLLRQILIVDTPGTNALERKHEAITRDFVPRSDFVLFVTSADRPFTESERAFLESIQDWGKKIVFLVNKADLLRNEEDRDRVREFVEENALKLLGFAPRTFLVSARMALESGDDPDARDQSGLPELERFLEETLDESERIRLKLLNPLGVGLRLAERQADLVGERVDLLRADFTSLDDIERQLDVFREDMDREFRFRLSKADNVLLELERRGMDLFDDLMRLPRILDLVNKERVKGEFQRRVIADSPAHLEKEVDALIDWMVGSELKQWRAVTDRLEARRAAHAERIVGGFGRFELDRDRLLDTVGREARRAIDGYDREAEASRIADSVQAAVAGTALLEAGAVGLGALVTVLATTQLADVTGLLGASAMAVLGLFVIPARRRKAKTQLAARISELRAQLMGALEGQFTTELEASLLRIRDAISPYTRFVRAERQRLSSAQAGLEEIQGQLEALRTRVENL